MSRYDTGRLLGIATKVLAQKAVERAHGGWLPPKEVIRRQKEAEKQHKEHIQAQEKQKKEQERAEKARGGMSVRKVAKVRTVPTVPHYAEGGGIGQNPAEQPYDLGQQVQRGAEMVSRIPESVNRVFVQPITSGIQELMRPVYEGGDASSYQNQEMVGKALDVIGGLGAGSLLTGPSAAATNVMRSGMGPVAKEAVAQAPRQLSPMGFYSPAAERAAQLQPKGDAAQFISALKNTPGIKAEELMNAGLIDAQGNIHPEWASRGKLTREDVVSHLQSQMPQVEETVLGRPIKGTPYPEEYTKIEQSIIDKYKPELDRYQAMSRDTSLGQPERNAALQSGYKLQDQMWAEMDSALPDRDIKAQQARDIDVPAKYQDYTLPGGENYREILLKLQPEMRDLALDEVNAARQKISPMLRPLTQDEYQAQLSKGNIVRVKKNPDAPIFQSSHFPDPDILAHIRMADRTGPNGEKILHVEELQSDWGQKGKKQGFKGGQEEYQKLLDEAYDAREKMFSYFEGLPERHKPTGQEIHSDIDRMIGGRDPIYINPEGEAKPLIDRFKSTYAAVNKADTALPSAPYVTSTEGWTDLALKRVLKEAAEGGYDKVVWTPGAEQAARYDLSKQISRVVYSPETEMLNAFDHSNKSVLQRSGVKPDQVEDYIGKEPAKKLFEQQNIKTYRKGGKDSNYHEISGLDLKAGGEGMNEYYDKIVPNRLSALAKKHDKNAKVGITDVLLPPSNKRGSNNPPMEAPGITITPQMRESILRGQSAYQRGGAVDRNELSKAAHAGRNGDNILAHINPQEAEMLKQMGGSGAINPKTGLPEFSGADPSGSSVTSSNQSPSYSGSDRDSSSSNQSPNYGGGGGGGGGSGISGSSNNGGGGGGGGSGIGIGGGGASSSAPSASGRPESAAEGEVAGPKSMLGNLSLGSDIGSEYAKAAMTPDLGFGGAEVMSPMNLGIQNGVLVGGLPASGSPTSQQQMLQAMGIKGSPIQSGVGGIGSDVVAGGTGMGLATRDNLEDPRSPAEIEATQRAVRWGEAIGSGIRSLGESLAEQPQGAVDPSIMARAAMPATPAAPAEDFTAADSQKLYNQMLMSGIGREWDAPRAGDMSQVSADPYGAMNAPLAVSQIPQSTIDTTQSGPSNGQSLEEYMGTVPPSEMQYMVQKQVQPVPNQYMVDVKGFLDATKSPFPYAMTYGKAIPQLAASGISFKPTTGIDPELGVPTSGIATYKAPKSDLSAEEAKQQYDKFMADYGKTFSPMMKTSYGMQERSPMTAGDLTGPAMGFDSFVSSGPTSDVSQTVSTPSYGATPSSSATVTPLTSPISTAQAAQPQGVYSAPLQQGQTVRQNFEQAFADARSKGLSTFTWTNPATGERGVYKTALGRKEGGRVYPLSDREQWKDHQRDHDDDARLVEMAPDKFLGKAQDLEDTKSNKKDIKHWEKKIKKGKKIGPAALYTDGSQDGRHRVTAAKNLGIKKVPVLTWAERGSEAKDDYMASATKIARKAKK